MIEAILIWGAVALLIVTETAGFILRGFGFITISEASRKNKRLQLAVSALLLVVFAWWQVHSCAIAYLLGHACLR